jgi:hypothetical protein
MVFNKLKQWFNRRMAMLTLAMSNVEKNALGQQGETLGSDVNQTQRNTQGQLADSLKQGEITQEVMNLRWRTYKILKESEGVTAEIVGYDEDGMPIVKTKKVNKKLGLKKVKLDPSDDYKLEMVVDNSEIVIGSNQAMNNDNISLFDEVIQSTNENGDLVATHGIIESINYFATNKSERPIIIIRENLPNFYLENFTLKMNVRTIDKTNKLLEFYVSKYPDEYNRTSRLFISEVKKIMNDGINSTMLDFNEINFITYKTLGTDDYLEYEYDNISYDKIVEYNGYYVIKFNAKIKTDGNDILDAYRVKELDKKYEQKAKK